MKGDARRHHAVGQIAACRHPQALVVEESAFALLGVIHLIGDGVEHQASDNFAVHFEPDGNGEMRNAVQEIGGAVDRIDDEAVIGVAAGDNSGLLGEEGIAGPRLGELLA